MLAQAVAKALNKRLIIWNIKSTTKAQDGLYVYDTIQRLYDGQFGEEGVNDIARYIKLGKLGEAFDSEDQVILLIDEIDKADLEFPNDLLWELDQMEFYINETKRTVKAKHRPIVIITSNAEKELPDAFLRRCIFHYIDFPDKELMEQIVAVSAGQEISGYTLSSEAPANPSGTLKVGMECAYEPYNWTDMEGTTPGCVPISGEGKDGLYANGYDVQIAQYVANQMGLKLEIYSIEWNSLLPALESGAIDAIIAGMSPTAEREAEIDFTQTYYESNLVVIIRK